MKAKKKVRKNRKKVKKKERKEIKCKITVISLSTLLNLPASQSPTIAVRSIQRYLHIVLKTSVLVIYCPR